MNYWLHRISHESAVSYPLLDGGILTIGWSDIADDDFINKCTDNWKNFEAEYLKKIGNSSKSRYSLWRFISEMKKGDLVLIPSVGRFSIYEISDDRAFSVEQLDLSNFKDINSNNIIKKEGRLYRIDKSNKVSIIDLGFFRKIKPVVLGIERDKYADQALISRMKIRTTNAQISDIKESVDKAIENFKSKKPINLHSIIIEHINSQVLSLVLTWLDDIKFEKLITWYFKRCGASDVQLLSKNASDKKGDADVMATFESIKTIIYVQAKKHEGLTDEWALEQINEYKMEKESMDDGYVKVGWVISSATSFSEICNKAASEARVLLINGPEFVKMLLNQGIAELDEAF